MFLRVAFYFTQMWYYSGEINIVYMEKFTFYIIKLPSDNLITWILIWFSTGDMFFCLFGSQLREVLMHFSLSALGQHNGLFCFEICIKITVFHVTVNSGFWNFSQVIQDRSYKGSTGWYDSLWKFISPKFYISVNILTPWRCVS